jgi:hypothetical protein
MPVVRNGRMTVQVQGARNYLDKVYKNSVPNQLLLIFEKKKKKRNIRESLRDFCVM